MANVEEELELRSDALGPVPNPINGGDKGYLQCSAHTGPIRAAFESALGVKVQHGVFGGKIWNMLLQLESTDRVQAVEKLEGKQGISRATIQRKGKPVYVVYMSKKEREERKSQTLEDTLSERAKKIEIPEEQLAKIDACWLKEEEYKEVCKALHEDQHDWTGVNSRVKSISTQAFLNTRVDTAPAFRAFEERAAAFTAQKEEKDTHKLEQLMKSAEAELSFAKEKLATCREDKKNFTSDLRKYNKRRDELKAEAVHLALDSYSDHAKIAEIQLKRRRLIDTISETEGKVSSLAVSISEYEKRTKELETKIEDLAAKVDPKTDGQPSSKRQRL